MVAVIYTKARPDLASQMGLGLAGRPAVAHEG